MFTPPLLKVLTHGATAPSPTIHIAFFCLGKLKHNNLSCEMLSHSSLFFLNKPIINLKSGQ